MATLVDNLTTLTNCLEMALTTNPQSVFRFLRQRRGNWHAGHLTTYLPFCISLAALEFLRDLETWRLRRS